MRTLLAAIAAPAALIAAPTAALAAEPATLQLPAEASVSAAPDLAEVSVGVTTNAPTASAAATANAQAMNAVVAALKRARIAEKDLQTSNFSLQPQYDYERGDAPKLTGYQASNQLRVIVRDIGDLGRVIDLVVASGSNQIQGIEFGFAAPEGLMDQARKDAIAAARARAALYAQAAGFSTARITAIREGAAEPDPQPIRVMATRMVSAESTPIEAGELALTARVSVTFALE